jgi:hypothetical protein
LCKERLVDDHEKRNARFLQPGMVECKSSAATSISDDIVNITDVDLTHEEDTDLKM